MPDQQPRYRLGVVTVTSPFTVRLGGDSSGDSDVAGIPYLGSYTPAVNDVVVIALDGRGGSFCLGTTQGGGGGGLVAVKKLTANHTGITTETTINADASSTMEITWTADTTRAYRVRGWARMDASGSDAEPHLKITDGSNVQKAEDYAYTVVGGNPRFGWVEEIINGGASGSTTRRLRAVTPFSTLDVIAASTRPAVFMVEDIGAAV